MLSVSWRKPLDVEIGVAIKGYIFIIANRCKGCGFCIEFCPKGVLEFSEDLNPKGYHPPIVVEGKLVECENCQLCQLICPDFAIYNLSMEEYQEQLKNNQVKKPIKPEKPIEDKKPSKINKAKTKT